MSENSDFDLFQVFSFLPLFEIMNLFDGAVKVDE